MMPGIGSVGGFMSSRRYVTESSPSLPIMTSNTTPSGHVASASQSAGANFAPWYAFDGANSVNTDVGTWHTDSITPPQWLMRQTPTQIRVGAYKIGCAASLAGRAPRKWILQGSNNGASWTNLDSQEGQIFSGSFNETKSFIIMEANRGFYSYHRLYVTETYAGTAYNWLSVSELTLLQDVLE